MNFMKRKFKNIFMLSLIIGLLSSYQEKSRLCKVKGKNCKVYLERGEHTNNPAIADFNFSLIPVHKFILVQ